MLQLMNGLKIWQVGMLLTVLVLGGGIAYGTYVVVIDSSGNTSISENEQLIPVSRGDLVTDVSVSGELTYPIRESLGFGTTGKVSQVLVEEGQSVTLGQLLAALDEETIAALNKIVAQTQISIRDSEEALAEARNPATDLELAMAKANVSDARVVHAVALKALAEEQNSASDLELAMAKANVADAKVSLVASEKSLAEVMGVDSETVARAGSTIVAAKIALEDAKEALDITLSGPTADDVAKAQLKVASTVTAQTNAYRDKKISISEWEDKIKTAEDTLATAVEGYKLVFSTWLGIALDEEQQYQNSDVLLDLFGVSLESLFNFDSRFSIQKLGNLSPHPSDDPDTEWDELIIYTWQNFYPGIVYPTCSGDNISVGDACVQQELEDGFQLVQQAVDMLEITNISANKVLANAEITIANSEDSSSTALQALEDLNETPDQLRIEALETDIVVAQSALNTAVSELASFISEPNEVDLEAERMNVLLFKAYLDIAEQDLQELTGDPDPIGLDALEKQLDVAVEKLRAAEKDLAELQQDPDPLIVALREKDLAAAQYSLDSTLETLETTAITAPWNGIISAVNIDVGQHINLNTSAIEIINPTVVEIDGAVDEIDVLYLREGATASITLDALPGQTLEGSVSEIATQSTNQQGVVTYPISIRVETNGMQLPQGLTAVASIVLREDNNVLLIPLDALYGSFDNPLVRVSINGQIKERSVELGNTDDFWVAIISGVAESELIVIQSQQAETSFGWGGFGRGGFGGFGGSRGSSSWSGGPPH